MGGFKLLDKHLDNQLKAHEAAALIPALAATKEECAKAGNSSSICDTITGSANTEECGSQTCWIVYTRSKNPYDYNAAMYVRQDGGGKYVVSDYRSGVIRRQ